MRRGSCPRPANAPPVSIRASAEAEAVEAGHRRGVGRHAQADVEAAAGVQRPDLRRGEGGVAQVVAVGGEDDRGVGALLALAGQADRHPVLPHRSARV